jgi:hypothetical protein
VTLAGTTGACAALSGLTDYQECAGDCAGAIADDASSAETPTDSGDLAEVSTTPPDEGSPQEEEASLSADGNFVDVAGFDSAWDAPAQPPEAGSPGLDAGNDAGGDAASDAGRDASIDAASEVGPPPATCGPKGTTSRCYANQVCCANLAAQTNACAATCAANESLSCTTASDCPQSTPICCAQATFTPDSNGDPSPKCTATAFSAVCASTCNDSPPATGCSFVGTIRLCTHDTDCQSDTSNPVGGQANQCWNYNSAPESWCTNATLGGVGGGVHQP